MLEILDCNPNPSYLSTAVCSCSQAELGKIVKESTQIDHMQKEKKKPINMYALPGGFQQYQFPKRYHRGVDGVFLLNVMNILHGILLFYRKYKKNFRVSKAA